MKDDLRYTPSDCFETFPFPPNWATDPALEAAGEAYYNYRAALMLENDEGLTKTYYRFHSPNDKSPAIARLRELHAVMDAAVLTAYGWTDLTPTCDFLLDYDDDSDPDTPSTKKKPYRYRWPYDLQAEILARLLEENARRAALQSSASSATRARGHRSAAPPTALQNPLLPPEA